MSHLASAWAMQLTEDITTGEKMVAMVLADRHNPDTGLAERISIPTIAMLAVMSRSGVFAALTALEEKGIVERHAGEPGKGTAYSFPTMPDPTEFWASMRRSKQGGPLTGPVQKGVHSLDPTTINEKKILPTVVSSAQAETQAKAHWDAWQPRLAALLPDTPKSKVGGYMVILLRDAGQDHGTVAEAIRYAEDNLPGSTSSQRMAAMRAKIGHLLAKSLRRQNREAARG